MSHTPDAPVIFVIDTDSYAGNFERDLCAYITGNVGECGVGEDMAALFAEETGEEPFENVFPEPDEHGCHRPATLYPAPNGDPNAVAISFESKPTADQISLMKERALQFAANMMERDYTRSEGYTKDPRIGKILGFRLIEQAITRTLVEEAV